MIEKSKGVLDKGRHFTALLTNLSKAFYCLPDDLIIAKLDTYGFKNDALCLIFNHFNNRKQRVNINSSFSSFSKYYRWCSRRFFVGPFVI